MPITRLDRSLIHIKGERAQTWLDGLITNSLSTSRVTFAALLTPQGKIIADFFVHPIGVDGAEFILETAPKFSSDLLKRLKMYKLREAINVTDITASHNLYVMWDGGEYENDESATYKAWPDPRLPALGYRIIDDGNLDKGLTFEPQNTQERYNQHRLSLGIVESHWDFETMSVFPADVNMDVIAGIDFSKGCFIGQEVVSRMKRMTTVKKRARAYICPDDFPDSKPVKSGTAIMANERIIGTVMYHEGHQGIAIIRLDRWAAAEVAPTLEMYEIQIMDSPDGYST